jgi:hypothetical protein
LLSRPEALPQCGNASGEFAPSASSAYGLGVLPQAKRRKQIPQRGNCSPSEAIPANAGTLLLKNRSRRVFVCGSPICQFRPEGRIGLARAQRRCAVLGMEFCAKRKTPAGIASGVRFEQGVLRFAQTAGGYCFGRGSNRGAGLKPLRGLSMEFARCANSGGNRVYGTSVQVYGTSVQVYGNSVQVYGTSVQVYGTSVQVYGNSVQVYGTSVQVYGTSVQAYGNSVRSYGNFVRAGIGVRRTVKNGPLIIFRRVLWI